MLSLCLVVCSFSFLGYSSSVALPHMPCISRSLICLGCLCPLSGSLPPSGFFAYRRAYLSYSGLCFLGAAPFLRLFRCMPWVFLPAPHACLLPSCFPPFFSYFLP